ncbi:MAG: cyclase family protein [Patescibacteria group bacterium]|nr:cyclase family protein [Patescibacteria group bacterium]
MRFIDLTRTLTDHIAVYPGDPAVHLADVATLAKDGYRGSRIDAGVHAGTHLDAPAHFIENGKRVDEMDAARLIGRGRLVDARKFRTIDAHLLEELTVEPGDIVLIWTGWSKKFGDPKYFTDFPELTAELAKRIIAAGAVMVGLDSPSPDRPPHAVHRLLMQADIAIVENLTGLELLASATPFEVVALPAKWHTEAAPVRVVARIF